MKEDMTVPCGEGVINIRVGAIIMKDGKLLMAGNNVNPGYMYSVGGRVKFGETAEEAVVREVFEETGVKMEVDRLGFVNENYFYCDSAKYLNKLMYEISFYYYMKVPEDFEYVSGTFVDGGTEEFLKWIDVDGDIKYFPEFFRTELKNPQTKVKHIVTDER
jgi:ADP-ribose pyrophosphatase YjhB (NUDIX family)